jgi:hypothetical protein
MSRGHRKTREVTVVLQRVRRPSASRGPRSGQKNGDFGNYTIPVWFGGVMGHNPAYREWNRKSGTPTGGNSDGKDDWNSPSRGGICGNDADYLGMLAVICASPPLAKRGYSGRCTESPRPGEGETPSVRPSDQNVFAPSRVGLWLSLKDLTKKYRASVRAGLDRSFRHPKLFTS